MKLNLWISLPLSMICLIANANTTTPASTTTTTVASTAPATPAATTATTAAAPAATSTAAAPKKEEPPSVKYGISYEAGYSMQAQTQPDGTRSQSLSHSFTPSLSYGEYRSSVSIGYEQDLNDSASNGYADPTFALSKKAWTLGKYLKLGPSGTLTLPMTDASKNKVGLMYNIGGALGLSLITKEIGMEKLSASYQIAVNKNFTNYDTNSSGNPQTSHKLRNRLSLGYGITDSISFFNMFDFNSSYSVNGVVTNSFFSLQSFGYTVNDNVSLSFAHSNGGAYLKTGTYENNLKFFDAENSTYSLALEVSL